ncbi:sensor histidine kinase [Alteromonas gracilis]|uniref:sensor histidine kinase n=1 Tax=Alteromonas gracilis TaxID=1479524 RepID=UPI0030CE6DDE
MNSSRLVIKNLSSHQIVTLSESLFEQALYNVIDNKHKFSERTVKQRASSIGDNIQFQIFDEGIGFSDAILDALFALFKSTRQQGSGIGLELRLSVSMGIVDAHNGTITVSNDIVACCLTLVCPY